MYTNEICKLILGTALDKPENGIVTFVDNYENFDASEYDFANSAVVAGTFSIDKGDSLVIIQNGIDDGDEKFCIGIIEDTDINDLTDSRLNDEFENIPIKSKKGNSTFFINEKTISLSTISSNLTIDGERFEANIPNTTLKLNSGIWGMIASKNDKVTSSIVGSEDQIHLFGNQKILMESREFHFKANDGNFVISGKKDSTYEGTDEIEKYESLNAFVLKSRTMDFISQGSGINFHAGHMGIKIGSSKFSSYTPGAGPDEAFHINAVQGGIKFETGLGNIDIQTNNLAFIDTIKIRCGSILHPTASGIEMGALTNRLYLDTLFEGINSELVFNTGGFTELNSFMNIDINSQVGGVNISATLETIIEGMLGAKLKGMMVDIIADAMVNIEAQIVNLKAGAVLDLSGSSMINAGPKMATPSGSGPFCALPVCLFTGAIHNGSSCM